jgi:Second Messenger Oligonucleotide or Dinucleotide Synthetase domain
LEYDVSWSAAARAEEPDHANDVLEEIRQAISASDDDLREARRRRYLVLKAAGSFDGALRTFKSGSVAHGNVNNPVDDADGGVVLDRRMHVTVGPDSANGDGPEEIVDEAREHVMAIVRATYPKARSRLIKRAILVRFNEPNADGVDPSVDLIVALTRKDAEGLWIPNRDKDDWDASHPEEHTRLLTADGKGLRVHRARVIRLAKAAIKHDSTPALISFNVEVLALKHVTEVKTLAESLQLFFDKVASSIKAKLTDDPARVSGKIKLPDGMTRERSAKRLRHFADKVQDAIDHSDDRAAVEAALAELYADQLPDAQRFAKAQLADAIRRGNEGGIRSGLAIAPAAAMKTPRSYGGHAASS